ncbi:extended synaptotagmin-like protein 2b [Helobdella robusta]|uniref:Extended synaptotagmin-like protein 2b n=1 Tax=Helobdella robusta TaxID=6412 RepID=T1FMK7_HELRO|nr:extended synaptotagmin-like protein 2b [Helobdella robusta]ESO10642.1 extended synaptotagmin-like protein 2b [Helobdella robusta]
MSEISEMTPVKSDIATVDTDSQRNLKKTTRSQTVQLLPLIVKSATTAGFLFAVWGAGFYRFSVSWVIGASTAYFIGKQYKKSLKEEKKRLEEERELEEPTLARVDELPTWVYFPDVERAEWLNKMIQQMWPYIGEHVCKTIASLEKMIDEKLPSIIRPFKFEEITLGEIPPRLGGVKVYIDNVKRDEIVLDAEITYAGDCDINLSMRGLHAGIKDILLHGMIRIIFRPLINKIPLIGGLEFCFINLPNLDFDLTNLANIFDVPFLNDSLRKIITDQVSNFLVLPNVIRVDLVSPSDLLNTKPSGHRGVTVGGIGGITLPYGVLRIKMVEADDLKRADAGKIFGKGKSDPYAVVTVGGTTYKTKYIASTLSPRWDEVFEFAVDDVKTQEIEIKVYDHDDHASDDFIGNTYIRLEEVEKGHMDEWRRLSNVKTGRVHVVCDLLYLTFDADDPGRIKSRSGSTCLLMVGVESAKDLPSTFSHSKGLLEPSPCVSLQLGNKLVKTTPKLRTIHPKWDEVFSFMVTEPDNEILFVQVLDTSKNDTSLGKISYKVDKILTDEDMMLCQPFALDATTSASTLTMKICLRYLTTTRPSTQEDPTTTATTIASDEIAGSPETIIPDYTDMVGRTRPGAASTAAKSGLAGGRSDNEAKARYRGSKTMSESKIGKMQLTLRYNLEREKLILIIHKCINLVAYDKDNFSDPYVRMYLLPDRSNASKRKTNVMKNNLNPVWDETFEWPLKKFELPNRTLEIMVKNFIGVFEKKTQTEMGVVNLRLSDFDDLAQPVSDCSTCRIQLHLRLPSQPSYKERERERKGKREREREREKERERAKEMKANFSTYSKKLLKKLSI